jgi:hypothetical protein
MALRPPPQKRCGNKEWRRFCGNAERRRCPCGSGHVHRLARHQRRRPGIAALKKVQAAVEQLNFRPSSIGRSLSSKSLGMIGIYTPSFFGAYYGTILQQTDIELRAIRRHVVVATGCGEGDRREETIEAVNFLIDRDCDGIVVLGHDLREEDMLALQKKQPRSPSSTGAIPMRQKQAFAPTTTAAANWRRGHWSKRAIASWP